MKCEQQWNGLVCYTQTWSFVKNTVYRPHKISGQTRKWPKLEVGQGLGEGFLWWLSPPAWLATVSGCRFEPIRTGQVCDKSPQRFVTRAVEQGCRSVRTYCLEAGHSGGGVQSVGLVEFSPLSPIRQVQGGWREVGWILGSRVGEWSRGIVLGQYVTVNRNCVKMPIWICGSLWHFFLTTNHQSLCSWWPITDHHCSWWPIMDHCRSPAYFFDLCFKVPSCLYLQ